MQGSEMLVATHSTAFADDSSTCSHGKIFACSPEFATCPSPPPWSLKRHLRWLRQAHRALVTVAETQCHHNAKAAGQLATGAGHSYYNML